MSRRLRLLKVVVQPVFVVDDDEAGLSELNIRPIEVAAQDWPTYAATGFVEAVEALRQQIEEEA